MATNEPITLKEVQLKLGVPQHVLIHLCEKGVIEPDFAQTSGRGKRREFSERNLFEFAVALEIRRFEIPVVTTAAIIRLVRSFSKAMVKLLPDFEMPQALVERCVHLALHLYGGDYMVFSAEGKELRKKLLLGFKLRNVLDGEAREPRVEKLDALPESYGSVLSIDLTKIAHQFS